MTQSITIKTGATLSLAMLVKLPTGTWACDSDVRKSDDTLIAALSASLTALSAPDADGNTHSGVLEATAAQTAAWPIGNWRADVRFTDTSTPAVRQISETFVVVVSAGVTHD